MVKDPVAETQQKPQTADKVKPGTTGAIGPEARRKSEAFANRTAGNAHQFQSGLSFFHSPQKSLRVALLNSILLMEVLQ